jgi:hypothetical protein
MQHKYIVHYTLDTRSTCPGEHEGEYGNRWRLLALRGFVDVIHHTTLYEDHCPPGQLESTYENNIP